MGLRPKALLAALALVAVVTGGLAAYVSRLYELSERRRIEEDLGEDAARLRGAIADSLERTRSALRPALVSQELVQLVHPGGAAEIKEGLDYFAREWCQLAGGDVSIVALDAFVARERKAKVLGGTANLALCGIHVTDRLKAALGPDAPGASSFLASAPLADLLERAFAGRPAGASIFTVGNTAFYGQALPFNDRLQEGEKAGVAAILVALTDGWVADQRKRGAGADRANPVHEVVYAREGAAEAVSGTSLPDHAQARLALAASAAAPVFEVRLGKENQRFIGRREILSEGAGLVALKNLDRELAPLARLRADVLWGGAVLGILGAGAAFGAAYLLIRRVEVLRRATLRIRQGDFGTRVPARGADEISALARAMNDMTAGLAALGLYTDPALARSAMGDTGFLRAAGTRETGSVFFCDIASFTTISERTPPEALVARLNRHFSLLGGRVTEEKGYLDKFNGDAVMAFWGPPFVRGGDHAARACRAALGSVAAAAEVAVRDAADGLDPFRIRVGIATGPVIVGNIGSDTKKNYTVIGDTVNLASRLEGANKLYGTVILVDQATRDAASGAIAFREVDRIRVVGKETPVAVHEPLGPAGAVDPARARAAERYATSLALYRSRDFRGALKELDALLEACPADGPALWLSGECERWMAEPPPEGWEAVTVAVEK